MGNTPKWLSDAVSDFGTTCKAKLKGTGDREAQIRAPIEVLIGEVGTNLKLPTILYDEVRDPDRAVRPDFAVEVSSVITGCIEVKAPGTNIDPNTFTGHNKRQWERQKDMPNLIYTNGSAWRLFREGEEVRSEVSFGGGTLKSAGSKLSCPPEFESLLNDFLRWKPSPITNASTLVRVLAPMTRLLRHEVSDTIAQERRNVELGASGNSQPFLGLADDWRRMLFPDLDDERFADQYAQAITFALVLARSENIDFAGKSLYDISQKLGVGHTLMGKALQILTEDIAKDFKVSLTMMVRVIGAVDWKRIETGNRNAFLYLYEDFLGHYDPELRKASGSYYTPPETVDTMVRLTEELLSGNLGKARGFADSSVITLDPAMGTGTYLESIIERTATNEANRNGPGAVAPMVSDLVKRLFGMEIQIGPYAIAELRMTGVLKRDGAKAPKNGLNLFLNDTLADPDAKHTQIGSRYNAISHSRERADRVKKKTNVTVVIGNPPYGERAKGRGGWIEQGSGDMGQGTKNRRRPNPPLLDDFRTTSGGRYEHKLSNMYVYFWRFATWKVFESTNDHTGVICFITPSGYLRGPAFKGMREYLRRTCSEGWIIDVSPEGLQPDVSTRLFPGVQHPLAISVFLREPNTDDAQPANVRIRSVVGRRTEKNSQLATISLNDGAWVATRTEWQASFTPAPQSDWDAFPAMDDLFPWTSPGVTPHRTWVYGTTPAILNQRWNSLVKAKDMTTKASLFKETRDRTLDRTFAPLAGLDTSQRTRIPLSTEGGLCPQPVPVAYRLLNRQWLIPDHRLIDVARPPLWEARISGQVFAIEPHTIVLHTGSALSFTSLVPDNDYFKGSGGGRVLPLLHSDGSANVAKGLLTTITTLYGFPVTAQDLLAYVAAVGSSPCFTETFVEELTTPGVRIPLTADGVLFSEIAELGREVVWTQTYGQAFTHSPNRPLDNIRFPIGDPRQPLCMTAPQDLSDEMNYDESTQTLTIGTGSWGPISPEVWNYSVGGKNVLRSWFNFRRPEPLGKKTSPLDRVNVTDWSASWTAEMIDLLTALTRLVALEDEQSRYLNQVLSGSLLSREALSKAGVNFPTSKADRSPVKRIENQLTLDVAMEDEVQASKPEAGSSQDENQKPSPHTVRKWAKKNGISVSDRGRVAASVYEAYAKDQARR